MTSSIYAVLHPYQEKIEQALKERQSTFGEKSKLQEACMYALSQGGKRFRPALVLMVANALPQKYDVMEAALSIEYTHTASLLADDLPCMDNETERRGKPATHILYGESTALLASYAMIAAAYAGIAKNVEKLRKQNHKNPDQVGILALECASKNTGVFGATGGQYLDLFPPQINYDTYLETVKRKTVSLFEISMVFGWLFGGGDLAELPQVTQAAHHFGLAFQMADDFDDAGDDIEQQRKMNIVSLLGEENATTMFHREIKSYLKCLDDLKIGSSELRILSDYLLETI